MRDPDRIPAILGKLATVWRRHPDLRLGQLISNAHLGKYSGIDLFYIEDDDLLAAVEWYDRVGAGDEPKTEG